MVWTRTAALALALVLCTGGVGLLLWLRASLPRLDGRLALPGLHGTVTVARDAFGIPRISAGDEHDGYFALGFVHAQDRLWQMEAQRRVGAGRLAELVGEPGLPSDRFMRTLGLYRLAEATYRDLDPPVRAAIDAYGEGVNAWLSTRDRPLPPEFQLLGATPEAWRPADTLVWGKLMALQLAGNWRDELLRARLAARLPPERMRVLWPEGAAAEGPTIQGLGDTAGALLAGLPEVVMPRLASNIWVVSGALSETGKPILANDPHLALQAPILWYLATLSVPGLEVSGATVPGVPFHLMGHNRGMAWGFTTTSSDTMDLFIERLEGADAYLTPDGPQPLETRPETIRVKDRPDVVITVRTTRHGPLVTDALTQPPPLPMALAAAALAPGDRTVQAMWKLNRATGWDEFVAAMADFHAPQQNVAMAAIDGTIGIYSPGRVPIRRQGDGTVPRPGWTGEFDWTGWIPFDQLPHARDPASGRLINANNKPVGPDYPWFLGATWPEPYRAQRIAELLDDRPRWSVEEMGRLQLDALSPAVAELKPLLLALRPRDQRQGAALDMLRGWDGRMARDRPEPLLWQAWLVELQRLLFAGPLGPDFPAYANPRPAVLAAALAGAGGFCGGPDCQPVLAAALDAALARLTRAQGESLAGWRWGNAHQALFPHLLFGRIPGLDRLTRLAIPDDGDDQTVNRGTYDAAGADGFAVRHGPGLRAVYDLADLPASRFVIATGQSGHPLSHHYDDLLTPWRDGGMVTLSPDRPFPHVLVLDPRP